MIKISDDIYVNPNRVDFINTSSREFVIGSKRLGYSRHLKNILADMIKWRREGNVKPFDCVESEKEHSMYNRAGFKQTTE